MAHTVEAPFVVAFANPFLLGTSDAKLKAERRRQEQPGVYGGCSATRDRSLDHLINPCNIRNAQERHIWPVKMTVYWMDAADPFVKAYCHGRRPVKKTSAATAHPTKTKKGKTVAAAGSRVRRKVGASTVGDDAGADAKGKGIPDETSGKGKGKGKGKGNGKGGGGSRGKSGEKEGGSTRRSKKAEPGKEHDDHEEKRTGSRSGGGKRKGQGEVQAREERVPGRRALWRGKWTGTRTGTRTRTKRKSGSHR
jgi:hypothetical protein